MRVSDVDFEDARIVSELEREALNKGDHFLADLLAHTHELAKENETLKDVETLGKWEENNGPADKYKQFFYDCFDRLDGDYPCPNVSSDHDCSLIFDAIMQGEENANTI